MKNKRPIAIPAYLREPVYSPGIVGLDYVARILQIEAKFWRRERSSEGARALEIAASALKVMNHETSPAKAFGWPEASGPSAEGDGK